MDPLWILAVVVAVLILTMVITLSAASVVSKYDLCTQPPISIDYEYAYPLPVYVERAAVTGCGGLLTTEEGTYAVVEGVTYEPNKFVKGSFCGASGSVGWVYNESELEVTLVVLKRNKWREYKRFPQNERQQGDFVASTGNYAQIVDNKIYVRKFNGGTATYDGPNLHTLVMIKGTATGCLLVTELESEWYVWWMDINFVLHGGRVVSSDHRPAAIYGRDKFAVLQLDLEVHTFHLTTAEVWEPVQVIQGTYVCTSEEAGVMAVRVDQGSHVFTLSLSSHTYLVADGTEMEANVAGVGTNLFVGTKAIFKS